MIENILNQKISILNLKNSNKNLKKKLGKTYKLTPKKLYNSNNKKVINKLLIQK